MERVSKTIVNDTEYIIHNYCKDAIICRGDFLWLNSMVTPLFRVPREGSTPRKIYQIAPEEIAEGMKIIIAKTIGIEKKSLFQQISRILGYARIGDKIQSNLENGFQLLIDNEIVGVKGDYVTLK